MKKIIWIVSLIIVVGAVIIIVKKSSEVRNSKVQNVAQKEETVSSDIDDTKDSDDSSNNSTNTSFEDLTDTIQTANTSQDKLVIGDDYFIQQINDIYANMEDYEGTYIEIEGFPMSNALWTFVGRYGPRLLYR